VFPHADAVCHLREMQGTTEIALCTQAYQAVQPPDLKMGFHTRPELPVSPNLKCLEAESIQIIREAVAESENLCCTWRAMRFT
jgi:sulfate adenylyltransferase subunit 2